MKKKVLIIEDVIDYYERFFQTVNSVKEYKALSTGICRSVAEAVELIRKHEPAVVLLDHNLSDSGGEGLEILRFVKVNFPQTIIISTTDFDAPGHAARRALDTYEESGWALMSVSKDCGLIQTALKSLVVFLFHNEKPKVVYPVHPLMRSQVWIELLHKNGLRLTAKPESSLVIITVCRDGHNGDGVWQGYKSHLIPPQQLIDALYPQHRCVLIETTVGLRMPQLHPLERTQVDMATLNSFFKKWAK